MAFKTIAVFMAVLFLSAGALQFNDPDPLRWAIVYAIAGIASLAALFFQLPSAVPIALALIAGIWALSLVPGIVSQAAYTGTEEEREFGGLFLICVWFVVILLYQRKQGSAADASPEAVSEE